MNDQQTTRERVLAVLMSTPATVGEIATASGVPEANVRYHLRVLRADREVDCTMLKCTATRSGLTYGWFKI